MQRQDIKGKGKQQEISAQTGTAQAKITFYYMGFSDTSKQIVNVNSGGHFSALLEIDHPALTQNKHRQLYISKYPNQEELEAQETQSRHSFIPGRKTKRAEFRPYIHEKADLDDVNETLKIEFDCTLPHSLYFKAMWEEAEKILKNPDQQAFNFYSDNCSTLIKNLLKIGNAPRYAQYNQVDKTFLESASGAVVPATLWEYIVLLKKNIDQLNQENDELNSKLSERLKDVHKTEEDKFEETLRLTKSQLLLYAPTRGESYSTFPETIEESGEIKPLPAAQLLTKITTQFDEIISTFKRNKHLDMAKKQVRTLIDDIGNTKIAREDQEFINNINSLLKKNFACFEDRDALLQMQIENAVNKLNNMQSKFENYFKETNKKNQASLLDNISRNYSLTNPHVKIVCDTLKAIYEVLQQINDNPDDKMANSLKIWQIIHTLRAQKAELLFDHIKALAPDQHALTKFYNEIENILTIITQRYHQALYFDTTQSNCTELLTNLTTYYGDKSNSNFDLITILKNREIQLRKDLKTAVEKIPLNIQKKCDISDTISCLQIIEKIAHSYQNLSFWQFEWWSWHIFNRGLRNDYLHVAQDLVLDAKINNKIFLFANGKINEPQLIANLDSLYFEKSKRLHADANRKDLKNLKTVIDTFEQNYTNYVASSQSILKDRIQPYLNSSLKILKKLNPLNSNRLWQLKKCLEGVKSFEIKRKTDLKQVDIYLPQVREEVKIYRLALKP